jgi:hypothetical protein
MDYTSEMAKIARMTISRTAYPIKKGCNGQPSHKSKRKHVYRPLLTIRMSSPTKTLCDSTHRIHIFENSYALPCTVLSLTCASFGANYQNTAFGFCSPSTVPYHVYRKSFFRDHRPCRWAHFYTIQYHRLSRHSTRRWQ